MSRLRMLKLVRDVWAMRMRALAMVAAIAVSVAAIAAFFTARAVLGREISGNYLAGNPASATLHVPSGVTPAVVALARSAPGVTDATARGSLVARVRVPGGPWQPIVLFVSDTSDPRRISTVAVERGTWPPADGALFLERTALPYLGVAVGQQVQLRAAGGPVVAMAVTGSVHDAGVAPASQERTAYGHVTRASLARLGQSTALRELKITVGDSRGASGNAAAIATTAQQVASSLAAAGTPVTGIDIPPPLRHPHYGQMVTVGFVLLAFGVIALLLSSILVATMLGGLLTTQIRQIGAMKAIGARTGQLFAMYVSLSVAIAAGATALAIGPGIALGRFLAGQGAQLLNLDITSASVPSWVIALTLAAGIGVPVLVSLPPLVRGTRRTVRAALEDFGSESASTSRIASTIARLPGFGRTEAMAVRAMARRPGRLALTVGLLAVAGGTFMTGLNASTGWDALVNDGVTHRHYDLEVRFDTPTDAARVLAVVRGVSGVTSAEAWGREPTSVAVPERVDVEHVYPDDAHGSFTVMAPPPQTALISLPLLSGRWLRADDSDAVVLTNLAVAQQAPSAAVGDTVRLTVAGAARPYQVVGIVSDFGTQGTAYVSDTEYAAVRGPATVGMVRVVTTAADAAGRQVLLDRTEQALDDAGLRVEGGFTTDTLRAALDGHVFVLIEALVAIALVIGFVGLLGLASAMSTSVTERTREFGVMHVVGATRAAVRGIVVTEGIFTGLAGLAVATIAAVPLTSAFGNFLGRQAFRQPLPFTMPPAPVLLWTVFTLVGAVAATTAAARRASRLTVREALAVL